MKWSELRERLNKIFQEDVDFFDIKVYVDSNNNISVFTDGTVGQIYIQQKELGDKKE